MHHVPMKKLSNGISIPQLGLGVYKVPSEQAYDTVSSALEVGYRHIDTASFYGNEAGVGKAIRDSGIPREDIFVTTKLWNDEHGYGKAQKAFEQSMERLGIDYIDLYLIHWPIQHVYPETWRAFEKIYKAGSAKAIGVSNFLEHHLKELMETAQIKPAVDQFELHPKLQERSTIDYCREQGIAVESWSPLGRAQYLDEPVLRSLAKKYQKSAAQILIRWQLQHEFIVIPKSTSKGRQLENFNVFDFEIESEDIKILDGMHEGLRIGSHPDVISRES